MVPAHAERANLQYGLYLSGVPDPKTIVEYCVAAEDAGWDGVFHIDHLSDYGLTDSPEVQPINDPWIT